MEKEFFTSRGDPARGLSSAEFERTEKILTEAKELCA
jgi:hypothetical protein|tara:strand:- start:4618 stop:4728 length:111 start_codon:yes stop_codon:yes gene_type:complete